jgi:hypothetical protein
MTTLYCFGVISYKIIGGVCVLFFTGCAAGAFVAGQYPPITIFAFFTLMGLFMMLSAGSFEISENNITHRNLFGTFTLTWLELTKIEMGTQGTIILHGEGKQFALPPPAYWSGKQKPAAFGLFQKTIESLSVTCYPSNTADYKIHKNVRVRTGV